MADHDLFAMDTCFRHRWGTYPLEARCAMLSDLGYDATYLTLFDAVDEDDARRVGSVAAEHGLDVTGIYTTLDVAEATAGTGDGGLSDLLDALPSFDAGTVELAVDHGGDGIDPSDQAGDDAAAATLGRICDRAAEHDVSVVLYPHVGFWLERVEDAARLCDRLDRDNLGAAFCGFHWCAVDGEDLPGSVEAAADHLESVNVSGVAWPDGEGSATIVPLYRGSFDNFALLGLLERAGYDGPIGVQGFGVGGDVYAVLDRSLSALEGMLDRLDRRPAWASIDFDRTTP